LISLTNLTRRIALWRTSNFPSGFTLWPEN
jgi:hypothetical protein